MRMEPDDSRHGTKQSYFDEVRRRVAAQTPEILHEDRTKLVRGYTAFVAAALFAYVTKASEAGGGWLIICLLSVSLPALVGDILLDRTVTVIQRRKISHFRGLAVALGFPPSMLAFALAIGHISIVAAALFVIGCVFWFFVVDVVTYLGAFRQDSES